MEQFGRGSIEQQGWPKHYVDLCGSKECKNFGLRRTNAQKRSPFTQWVEWLCCALCSRHENQLITIDSSDQIYGLHGIFFWRIQLLYLYTLHLSLVCTLLMLRPLKWVWLEKNYNNLIHEPRSSIKLNLTQTFLWPCNLSMHMALRDTDIAKHSIVWIYGRFNRTPMLHKIFSIFWAIN